MPEFGEKPPKRKKLEAGDILYSPYKPPKRTPEGHRWVVVEKHFDKNYPLRWRLEKLDTEPPTLGELPPQEPQPGNRRSSMFPTDKPPRENVPMGGVPRGDLD
ncbi:MAG TPA: hypothetical protein VJ481_01695 [Patescibacteria group bacterium]|uniref:Uncharacterized protein n=1 Tax=Candidatus Woesebacteria bacterium RBG_13_46_13 TaxID=1802479 RepID=A0A1F7X6Y0_9BACT|nr:MAG: hypothetical protein A2Y68_01470 [Candidatus Woesebacteria bacterium RBG_13_46_13]HJX59254.1 hypothetical protein [Patescibacteria group bacterium]